MKRIILIATIIILFVVPAYADLQLLGQGTSVHGTYNLIYDTDLDITWYDYSNLGAWQNQVNWAGGLSITTAAATYDDWRLPTTVDGIIISGFDGSTTAGYNITSSEMGHLFYTELGNTGYYDTFGNLTSCNSNLPICLTNTGVFQDLRPDDYWSGTEYSTNPDHAWHFLFQYGSQALNNKNNIHYALAVMEGMAIVPDSIADWEIETIDSTGNVGSLSSIAVDSSGGVHISYLDDTNTALKYATNASGTWRIETIDNSGYIGASTSIAVDSSGGVHISYVVKGIDDLKYATNRNVSPGNGTCYNTVWDCETVDSLGTVGYYNSITVDLNNKAHISYVYQTHFTTLAELRYATNASGIWEVETAYSGFTKAVTSIAVDSSGGVHISFGSLKYATNTSGIWVSENIDYTGDMGTYTSIALDARSGVHISYFDAYSYVFDLNYATNSNVTPGTGNCINTDWDCETVDSLGYFGEYNSIALDSISGVHISYFDRHNTALKYATNASGTWQIETVDNTGSMGLSGTSITIDSSDDVHISYADHTNRDLKYVTNHCIPVPEICDSIDNDCDGSVDEDLTRPTICGVGECAGNAGEETCTAGAWGNDTCDPLAGAVFEGPPSDQTCGDTLDNDCDGLSDLADSGCWLPISSYDTNQDWIIGDFELLNAIDNWAAGNLGDFELLDLIDFWAYGSYCWDYVEEKHKQDNCTINIPAQYAIDFTDCTGTFCRVLVIIDDLAAATFPIDNRPLTAEAWVKVKSASSTGAITGRIGAQGGLALVVKNNVPKFLIKQLSSPTSTQRIVESNVSLIQNVWTHIAGVLSNTVHSHPSTSSCALNVGNQTPHLDIHVDGVFRGCATTGSQFASSPGTQAMGIGVHGESGVPVDGTITDSIPFNGIIDEVRIWGVERTSAEINACMNQELGLTGNCNRMNGLVGYMRFNEGQGSSTADWIGLGLGVKEKLGPLSEWDEGWTTDSPLLKTLFYY